jgi:uncharacterized protein YbjQ (UPF0145 family)
MLVVTTPTIEGKRVTRYFGVDLDYETIGANGSMLTVSASGTAVLVE